MPPPRFRRLGDVRCLKRYSTMVRKFAVFKVKENNFREKHKQVYGLRGITIKGREKVDVQLIKVAHLCGMTSEIYNYIVVIK